MSSRVCLTFQTCILYSLCCQHQRLCLPFPRVVGRLSTRCYRQLLAWLGGTILDPYHRLAESTCELRGRFQVGIGLMGCEARTVMGALARGGGGFRCPFTPLPWHSAASGDALLLRCHELATAAWQGMGLVCTYVVQFIPEFAKEGCTVTLCMHGLFHTWFNPHTPILDSDEVGERDLRVAKICLHSKYQA